MLSVGGAATFAGRGRFGLRGSDGGLGGGRCEARGAGFHLGARRCFRRGGTMSMAWWAMAAAGGGLLAAWPLLWWADRPDGGRRADGRFACCGPAGGWDWVPVGWWAARRGRCPQCRRRVPLRYPLLEIACGGLWAAAVPAVGVAPVLPAYLWFVSITLVLAVIDGERMRLPNRILLPGTLIGLLLLAAGALLEGGAARFGEAMAAGAGSFAMMLAIALLSRGGLGYGDVKLAFLLGLFTGYIGWRGAVLSLVGAFAAGAATGAILLAARRRTRRDALAFGPFMVAAAWLAVAIGPSILEAGGSVMTGFAPGGL